MTVFSKINKQFIPFGLLLFFVMSMPLKNSINSISIILLTLYSVYLQVSKPNFNVKNYRRFIPLVAYFLIALLSVLYSENTSRALKSINKLLPFVLLPFIFSTLPIVKKTVPYYFAILCFFCGFFVSVFSYQSLD